MTTIKNVAKKANTSIATVSAVVNNSAFVSPELRSRVEKAIKELRYAPNRLARGLRSKKSYLVGFIISDIRNIFYPEVYRGIEEVVDNNDYSIILCNTDNDNQKQQEYLEILAEKQVDGLIIALPSDELICEALKIKESGKPIVVIDYDSSLDCLDNVKVDNFEGAYNAVKHLIEMGHERIGIISHYANFPRKGERVVAYEQCLSDHSLEVRAEYIRIGGLSSEDGYRIAVDLLELDERPTTIFATNNRMILGVLRAVNERNLKVPEDIAIVGYDEFEWASYLKPPITTVYQPTYEMGLNAAKLLFRNIQSSKMKPVRIVNLKTSLIVRESSNYKLKKGKV